MSSSLFLAFFGVLQLTSSYSTNLDVEVLTNLGNDGYQCIPKAVEVLDDKTIIVGCNYLVAPGLNNEPIPAQNYDLLKKYDMATKTWVTPEERIDEATSKATLIAIEYPYNEVTSILKLGGGFIHDIASDGQTISVLGRYIGLAYLEYDNTNNNFIQIWRHTNSGFVSPTSSTVCHYIKRCDSTSNSRICKLDMNTYYIAFLGHGTGGGRYDRQNCIINKNTGEVEYYQRPSYKGYGIALDTNDAVDPNILMVGYKQLGSPKMQKPYWGRGGTNFNGGNVERLYPGGGSQYSSLGLTADTRIIDAKMTPNYIWIIGHADGGNTQFKRDIEDLNTNANNIAISSGDRYTNIDNLGGGKIHYVTKVDKYQDSNGNYNQPYGQFQITRRSDGKGNTLNPIAFDVDETNGLIFFAQTGAAFVQNRDSLTINNIAVGGSYSGGDAMLLVSNTDLTERKVWARFTNTNAQSGKSNAIDVDTNAGITAFVGNTINNGDDDAYIIPINEFTGTSYNTATNGQSGFLAIIKNDQFTTNQT